MFASSFLRALLLVVFIGFVSAQARVFRLNKSLVTSSFTAEGDAGEGGSGSRPNLLSLDGNAEKDDVSVAIRSASSVVQDWSLVCKQLCGAGLGGIPCAAYCSATTAGKMSKNSKAASILNPNKNMICQDLCGLQLGGEACNCNESTEIALASSPVLMEVHNGVCSSFCDRNAATLVGCSLCKNKKSGPPVVPAADGGDGGEDNVSGGANLDVVATTAAPVITTTPNWNELCVSLCRTGDGGSLCNCDLSPFFN